jgi:diguanylate cyclase (GGDEF)-like protein
MSAGAASLAFALAFAVALGFHRHRAAQLCGLMGLLALGVDAGSLQLREAALRLTPWLVLACAVMPESRLLSKRHGILLLVVGVLILLATQAPAGLLAMPVALAALPLFGLDPGRGAGVLLMMAGLVCFARYLHRFYTLELSLASMLFVGAVGPLRPTEFGGWLLLAAIIGLVGVLYASYRMAFIDTLTALPNRRALDESLSRLSGEFALAMIDIDHFKKFNDQYGHDAGDIVLRQVAARLRQKADGAVYRYGGEEFCVIYRNLDARRGSERLEAARADVEALSITLPNKPKAGKRSGNPPRPRQVGVTISAGVAGRSARRRETVDVLKAADQALYQAKGKGRNRVERG